MSKGKSKPANSEQPTTKQLEKISSEKTSSEKTSSEKTSSEKTSSEKPDERKHSNKEQKPQALPVSYIKGKRPNVTGPIGSRKPR